MIFYKKKNFFHILGGHKGNSYILGMFGKCMLNMYPKEYINILSLFASNINIRKKRQTTHPLLSCMKQNTLYLNFTAWIHRVSKRENGVRP